MVNSEKCHFMVNQGVALGHVTFERGIEVDKSKIDLIRSFRSPTSVKEVHSFLGHAGFYRRFVKGFSKIALPSAVCFKRTQLLTLMKSAKKPLTN